MHQSDIKDTEWVSIDNYDDYARQTRNFDRAILLSEISTSKES